MLINQLQKVYRSTLTLNEVCTIQQERGSKEE